MVVFWVALGVYTLVILLGDFFLLPDDKLNWCYAAQLEAQGYMLTKQYANVDAIRDPCYYERTIYLLGFSMFDCDFGRRMICAVLLGAAIGWERKAADRPAGIRTMSLVCLGAATFTMGGQFAFRSSTMGWDAARVSAAIPSGVGFLGSALIWKEATGEGANQRNSVHGITTAASLWLSASVGIGVGGALYVMSVWTVVLVVFVLRLGPQLVFQDDKSYGSEEEEDADTEYDWDTQHDKGSQRGGTAAETQDKDKEARTKEEKYSLMDEEAEEPSQLHLREQSLSTRTSETPQSADENVGLSSRHSRRLSSRHKRMSVLEQQRQSIRMQMPNFRD
jgi:uncharacterized membrane protein YhiD involved in acid resistance